MARPLILVSNDDGITAPGIRKLVSLMNTLGDVYVVAPDKPQSAMGHAVTINSTLHIEELSIDEGSQKEYSCSGTPADCVKLAKHELLPRTPDLCVSGINHGSNSSINVIYSGTMSAAIEAGLENIPAIGFSLCDYSYNADFEAAEDYVLFLAKSILETKIKSGIVLNVNIPPLSKKEIKGIRVCRQAKANWVEKFVKRTNPMGKTYFWLTGEFVNRDDGEDTDEWALENGYISVVPVEADLTEYKRIPEISHLSVEKANLPSLK